MMTPTPIPCRFFFWEIPQTRTTWKAGPCPIFKAIVAGFRGFQLHKKIGHKRRSRQTFDRIKFDTLRIHLPLLWKHQTLRSWHPETALKQVATWHPMTSHGALGISNDSLTVRNLQSPGLVGEPRNLLILPDAKFFRIERWCRWPKYPFLTTCTN